MVRRSLLTMLLTTVAHNAFAQSAGGTAPIAVPEVVVSAPTQYDPYSGKYNGAVAETSDVTGVNKPILDTPRSVYVVTPQTLQQQMPQSLVEAVRSIPGVYAGNGTGGNTDYLTLKGFEVNTTDAILVGSGNGLLVDGVRAPMNRALNANSNSVELLSGPASYLYGYSSEGGVLNVNRKLPLPEAHYTAEFLGGLPSGDFKNFAGSIDATGPLAKTADGVFAYRFVASASKSDPWRTGNPVSRDELIAPTLAYYSDMVNSVLAYEHGQNRQPYDRGVTSFNNAPLNIPRTVSYSEPFSNYSEKYDWVHGHTDFNLDKNTDFHLKYSYASTQMNQSVIRSDNQSDFNAATGDLKRYFSTNGPDGRVTDQGLIGFSGAHRFDTGILRHEVQAGADYYDATLTENNVWNSKSFGGFNLYNPVYGQANFGTLTATSHPAGEPLSLQKIRELGVFAQDAVTLGRLTLTGGGRYAQIYEYQRYAGSTQTDYTSYAFLPSTSALLKINDSASLFADYSKSYRPNIFATGLGVNLKFVGPILPQQGTGYEGGIKAKFLDGKLLAQASVFRIDKTNVQTLIGSALTFQQAQRSEGVALSLLGKITPNVDVNVAYSHQRVYVTDDIAANNTIGKQVVNAPSDIFALFGAYHFMDGALDGLTVSAGLSGATRNAVDSKNTFFLPSYVIANAGVSYSFKPQPGGPLTTLSFKVNNLFDTTYYPSSGSKTNWITVGDPRTFLFSMKVSL
ncbi:TonB-dependent siderophore receptor [Bradyrhizobium ontarionense]|uniref:TonB-dependent siderophore receptor n=1 Tax=Bradyrhizobium ontarionense TaxID=2898149 RepID=A0ABY3R796_9BRAD|nr:TonB-dependent siderophore receptor [Bradyrhizobium sp. A19]UFZ02696.1 TonB-dependent siderophore receptor [Bradyrhizobium sp. A19]